MLGYGDPLHKDEVVWTRRAQLRAGLQKCAKLIVVAQKRPGKSKKTWGEVLVDDRKKQGQLRGRLVNQDQPSVEENKL